MKKVLVADDNQALVGVMEIWFTRLNNYTLVTAHSNTEAVSVASENPDIDLVVIDMDCLAYGGIVSVLRGLCPECRILLYSGTLLSEADRERHGVDAILSKGSDPCDLFEELERMCAVEQC